MITHPPSFGPAIARAIESSARRRRIVAPSIAVALRRSAVMMLMMPM